MEDFGLLDDLATLGITTELRQGVDWGYGLSLSIDEPDGQSPMYFTHDAVLRMCQWWKIPVFPWRDSSHPGTVKGTLRLPFIGLWKERQVSFYLNRREIKGSAPGNRRFSEDKVMWFLSGSCGRTSFCVMEARHDFPPKDVMALQKRVEIEIRAVRC